MNEHISAFGILGVSIVLTGIIASGTAYAIRMAERNIITTTGSTREIVKSDRVKWTGEITRRVATTQIATGHTQLANDLVALQKYLKAQNVDPTALEVRQINAQEDVYYGSEGPRYPGTTLLRQTVILSTADVEGTTKIIAGLKELIGKGVPIATQNIEYVYAKLPELRVKLLGGAVADAKARAAEIAEAGGKSVGDLQSASSGVVQVLAPNSIDVSDYGMYDTASIEKEVMVTVRATFSVK